MITPFDVFFKWFYKIFAVINLSKIKTKNNIILSKTRKTVDTAVVLYYYKSVLKSLIQYIKGG